MSRLRRSNRFTSTNPEQSGAGREIEPDVLSVDGNAVFRLETTPAEALVIHCVDPRFQTAFRRFVTEELGIRNYIPLAVGGGVHSLASQVFLPKNFKVLWQQITFFVEAFSIHEIVIINHEDCRWYEKFSGYHPTIAAPAKCHSDLAEVARLLLQEFTGVRVRSYWAAIEGSNVVFTEVV